MMMDEAPTRDELLVNTGGQGSGYAEKVAATLDAIAERAHVDPHGALDAHPWLGAAIDADAHAGRFHAWGRSTVIDELAEAPVITRALFTALHERAGLADDWPVGNAGLIHVYGYLLSTIVTPYGLKRERWMAGELARAYGLNGDAFVPWASSTPLLERVTSAAIALLEGSPQRVAALDGGVSATLALGRNDSAAGPFALAYRLDELLITTFPVSSPEVILAEWDAEPRRLRWNAVAPERPRP